jgi:hypothetical protein
MLSGGCCVSSSKGWVSWLGTQDLRRTDALPDSEFESRQMCSCVFIKWMCGFIEWVGRFHRMGAFLRRSSPFRGILDQVSERGSRRNPSATLESSSRASIIFLSVVSIVFGGDGLGRSRGVGWSLRMFNGDEPRGSTDPRLDVDGDEGPGSGLFRRSSCSSSQVMLSPVGRGSRCLEAPAFRAARLSTRRSNSGDESARV